MPETKTLYYFTRTTYALKGIKDRRLKSTQLDKTNDPFESLAFRSESDAEAKTAECSRWRHGLDWHMLCLSETYKNPLMWGHYADKGKGICLGFDAIIYGGYSGPFKVDYQPARVGPNYEHPALASMPKDFKPYLNQGIFVKSRDWEYEKEWRMLMYYTDLTFDPVKNMHFVPFEKRLTLREILIGFDCDEENIRFRLESLIDDDKDPYPNPKPKIICTRLSLSAFEIEKVT